MEIELNEKVTLQPVCLMQGENRATTLRFSLPRTFLGCPLDQLTWQVRAQNQSTEAFMADALHPQPAEEDARFLLPWTVSEPFTRQSGALSVILVGTGPAPGKASALSTAAGSGTPAEAANPPSNPSAAPGEASAPSATAGSGTPAEAANPPSNPSAASAPGEAIADAPDTGDAAQPSPIVAKFALEGVEVAPSADTGGQAPQPPDYFEQAVQQTGQNAAQAESCALSAQTHAAAAAQSAQQAGQSATAAQQSAATAQQAAATAQGMDPAVYDPSLARQDIFALLGGMPPVYAGSQVQVCAAQGRIAQVCVQGQAVQSGSGAASPQNPRPIAGVQSANLTVNGKAVSLPLSSPLYAAQNPRTGQILRDTRTLAGQEVHHLALKTFTGQENFTLWGGQNTTWEYATDPMDVATLPTNDDMPTALCSHFANLLTPNQLWSATVQGFSASYRLFFRTQHATVQQFKQWLAAQYAAGTPVQVVYPLAQPQTQEKPDATPALPEGANTFQAEDENARVQVTLKRVFEA